MWVTVQVTTNTTEYPETEGEYRKAMTERERETKTQERVRVNACILLHECARDELVVSCRGVIISVAGLYVARPESAVTNGLLADETVRKQFALGAPRRNFHRADLSEKCYTRNRTTPHHATPRHAIPTDLVFHRHRLLTNVGF